MNFNTINVFLYVCACFSTKHPSAQLLLILKKIKYALCKFSDQYEKASAPLSQTKSMLFRSMLVIEGGTDEVCW